MSVILQYIKFSVIRTTRTDEAAISTYEQIRYKNWKSISSFERHRERPTIAESGTEHKAMPECHSSMTQVSK